MSQLHFLRKRAKQVQASLPVLATEPVLVPVTATEPVLVPVTATEPVLVPATATEPVLVPAPAIPTVIKKGGSFVRRFLRRPGIIIQHTMKDTSTDEIPKIVMTEISVSEPVVLVPEPESSQNL
jgi:hypothetical protein